MWGLGKDDPAAPDVDSHRMQDDVDAATPTDAPVLPDDVDSVIPVNAPVIPDDDLVITGADAPMTTGSLARVLSNVSSTLGLGLVLAAS